jgi:hypothetical protein
MACCAARWPTTPPRPRPYKVNKAPTCTPGAEGRLALDGAYPSEHTTIWRPPKARFAGLRGKIVKPQQDCKAESEALATPPAPYRILARRAA